MSIELPIKLLRKDWVNLSVYLFLRAVDLLLDRDGLGLGQVAQVAGGNFLVIHLLFFAACISLQAQSLDAYAFSMSELEMAANKKSELKNAGYFCYGFVTPMASRAHLVRAEGDK
jgi:hypothetical protein